MRWRMLRPVAPRQKQSNAMSPAASACGYKQSAEEAALTCVRTLFDCHSMRPRDQCFAGVAAA